MISTIYGMCKVKACRKKGRRDDPFTVIYMKRKEVSKLYCLYGTILYNISVSHKGLHKWTLI